MICEVLGCTNRTTNKIKGISFHRFPSDEVIKQKWIDILSRDGWSPNPLGRVCSVHFKAAEILKNPRRALLVDTAVPTILPPLNKEAFFNPINNASSKTTTDEIEGSSKNTFLSPKSLPIPTTNTNNETKNDIVRSKFSVLSELANDMNSIKSKISQHLKTRRAKNCRMKAKIEKLKHCLIEIKAENANNNPVLASLFENALREPPDTAIDQQLDDHHLSSKSSEHELPQQNESSVETTFKDPFVSHLTNELKKFLPEDYVLIKQDIQNILEAENT